ncbi:hypothetical protein RCL1_008872 [Eukaryota sp. TZLM3-RCL]
MAKSYKIESFVEPSLRKFSIKDEDEFCGQHRADVIVPFSSDKLYVVDVVTFDVCKLSAVKKSLSEVSPLFDAESRKFSTYNVDLSSLKCVSLFKCELCPFAISFYGSLGRCALSFLNNFSKLLGYGFFSL